jgi:hypothetical protein
MLLSVQPLKQNPLRLGFAKHRGFIVYAIPYAGIIQVRFIGSSALRPKARAELSGRTTTSPIYFFS